METTRKDQLLSRWLKCSARYLLIQFAVIYNKYSLDCQTVKKLRPVSQIFKHILAISPTNRKQMFTDSPPPSLWVIAKKIQTNPKNPVASMVWIHLHAHYSSHFRRSSALSRSNIHTQSDLPSQPEGDSAVPCSFLLISVFCYPMEKYLTQWSHYNIYHWFQYCPVLSIYL